MFKAFLTSNQTYSQRHRNSFQKFTTNFLCVLSVVVETTLKPFLETLTNISEKKLCQIWQNPMLVKSFSFAGTRAQLPVFNFRPALITLIFLKVNFHSFLKKNLDKSSSEHVEHLAY